MSVGVARKHAKVATGVGKHDRVHMLVLAHG